MTNILPSDLPQRENCPYCRVPYAIIFRNKQLTRLPLTPFNRKKNIWDLVQEHTNFECLQSPRLKRRDMGLASADVSEERSLDVEDRGPGLQEQRQDGANNKQEEATKVPRVMESARRSQRQKISTRKAQTSQQRTPSRRTAVSFEDDQATANGVPGPTAAVKLNHDSNECENCDLVQTAWGGYLGTEPYGHHFHPRGSAKSVEQPNVTTELHREERASRPGPTAIDLTSEQGVHDIDGFLSRFKKRRWPDEESWMRAEAQAKEEMFDVDAFVKDLETTAAASKLVVPSKVAGPAPARHGREEQNIAGASTIGGNRGRAETDE